MVLLEKTVETPENTPESSEPTLDDEDEKESEIVQKPEIIQTPDFVQEPAKKRGRPRKIRPEPKPRGRPPKVVAPPAPPAPSPAPSPAPPAPSLEQYNQQLLQALMDHSRNSVVRRQERWRDLVKF